MIITAVDSFILLLIDRLGVRHLEAMFGILVGLMAVAFGWMFADAGVDVGQVLEGKHWTAHCQRIEFDSMQSLRASEGHPNSVREV